MYLYMYIVAEYYWEFSMMINWKYPFYAIQEIKGKKQIKKMNTRVLFGAYVVNQEKNTCGFHCKAVKSQLIG